VGEIHTENANFPVGVSPTSAPVGVSPLPLYLG
jgi:hypothetical protein